MAERRACPCHRGRRQHLRMSVSRAFLVTMCVLTQVDLLRVAVSLEGFGDTQNGLRGGELLSDVSLRSCTYILGYVVSTCERRLGPNCFCHLLEDPAVPATKRRQLGRWS